jgi:hypothetical protein
MTHDQALQALQAALQSTALAGSRCEPDRLSQGQALPAIRWQVISATPTSDHCGNTEAGDDLRVQIDLYAAEYGQLRTLRTQALAALEAVTVFEGLRDAERPLPFDEDARAFRHSIDWIISLSNL